MNQSFLHNSIISNRKLYIYTIIWYLIPLLYISLVKEIILPTSITIVSLFFIFMTVGYTLSNKIQLKPRVNLSIDVYKLTKRIVVLTIALQILAFFRFYNTGINFLVHRNMIFEDADYLFGSSVLLTLYNSFLFPITICLLIYFLNLNLKNVQKKSNILLIIMFLIILFDGLIKFGRFQLLYILFLLFLNKDRLNIKNTHILMLMTFVFVLSFLVIYFRQFYSDSSVEGFNAIFNYTTLVDSVISYQYYGYMMLDKLTSNVPFFGYVTTGHSFAYLFYLAKLFTTKFGIFFNFPWENVNLLVSNGIYFSSIQNSINAFTTNFLPIFLDFGYLGIVFFSLFSGFVLGYKTLSPFFQSTKLIYFFVLIFGLYQPLIIDFYFIFCNPLFYLLLAKIYYIKYGNIMS